MHPFLGRWADARHARFHIDNDGLEIPRLTNAKIEVTFEAVAIVITFGCPSCFARLFTLSCSWYYYLTTAIVYADAGGVTLAAFSSSSYFFGQVTIAAHGVPGFGMRAGGVSLNRGLPEVVVDGGCHPLRPEEP